MLSPSPPDPPQELHEHFLADHRRLEDVLERVLAACEANDREALGPLWTEFEVGLLAHLDAEDAHLLPALFAAAPQDARVIVQEHRHIRSRLAELGVAVDLHTLRLETARLFIDELRAHARTEDRLLYAWGDAHLDAPRRTSIIAALAEALRVRRAARREAAPA